LAQAGLEHPGASLHADAAELISDPSIDAVVIATPVDKHFELALAALEAGKHVFIEKPMTRTSGESERLIEESDRRALVLMVDHTFLFEPAIGAIAQVLQNGELGRVRSWSSDRMNVGVTRGDVNVVWDLASHDLSILDFVLTTPPCAVAAQGIAPYPGALEREAHVALHFPDGLLACIHVDWLSPTKVRQIRITGSRGGLVYDGPEPMNKLMNKLTISGANGERTVALPESHAVEPLGRAVEHFCGCITTGNRPICDGAAGLRIVRLLEAADSSMQAGGSAVPVSTERVPA